MTADAHWEAVYKSRKATTVSWYEPTPEASLKTIERLTKGIPGRFIDVGGGASSLVDALLERGWTDLTVLDVAEPALRVARERLGDRANRVKWEVADITTWRAPVAYDVWHDRAVFHFLTTAEGRDGYKRAMLSGTRVGSLIIMATFAPDGPDRCSGLEVRRYSPEGLAEELGSDFHLVEGWREIHTTPNGGSQAFSWTVFRRARPVMGPGI